MDPFLHIPPSDYLLDSGRARGQLSLSQELFGRRKRPTGRGLHHLSLDEYACTEIFVTQCALVAQTSGAQHLIDLDCLMFLSSARQTQPS